MPPVVSVILGAFAAFIVWTLVRALRNGTISSDGVAYRAGEQPRMFASTAAVHGFGALLFGWLAVGDAIAGF
jgi:hypothetical protein